MHRNRTAKPKQKIEVLLTKQEIAILTHAADDAFRTMDEHVAFLIMREWMNDRYPQSEQQQAETEDAPNA